MSDSIPGLLYACNNHSLRFNKAVCYKADVSPGTARPFIGYFMAT